MHVPHLMRIGLPVLFLFGPLFYFYVKVLTDRTVRLRSRDFVHGIPFLRLCRVDAAILFLQRGREDH